MPTTDRDDPLVSGLRPRSKDLQAQSPKSPRPVGVQSWPETATPLVSICCITYNQVEYVRECIEGFLLQKTTFPIEILINDDASSDGTVDVIKEYEGRYPGVIKPIYQSENQYSKGRKPTIEFNLPRAKGKYVALCEGDDFWIDPLKLHKQVKLLERRPEISICFHPVKLLERGRFREDDLTKIPAIITTLSDLVRGNYIHTPSCVFRRQTGAWMGKHFCDSPLGDFYLHCMNAQFGAIYYLDEIMAVYRLHDKSMWSQQSLLGRLEKTQAAKQAIFRDLAVSHIGPRKILARSMVDTWFLLYCVTGKVQYPRCDVAWTGPYSGAMLGLLGRALSIKELGLAKKTLFSLALDAVRFWWRGSCAMIRCWWHERRNWGA